MIEALSLYCSRKIKQADPEGSVSAEVIAYEIGRQLSFYGTIILTAVVSWLTGRFMDAMIAMAGFAVLRKYSGGRHMPTLASCIAASAVIFNVIPFVQINSPFCFGVTLLSALLVGITGTRSPKHKWISVIIVLSNLILLHPVLALTFLVQAITVTLEGGVNHESKNRSLDL